MWGVAVYRGRLGPCHRWYAFGATRDGLHDPHRPDQSAAAAMRDSPSHTFFAWDCTSIQDPGWAWDRDGRPEAETYRRTREVPVGMWSEGRGVPCKEGGLEGRLGPLARPGVLDTGLPDPVPQSGV